MPHTPPTFDNICPPGMIHVFTSPASLKNQPVPPGRILRQGEHSCCVPFPLQRRERKKEKPPAVLPPPSTPQPQPQPTNSISTAELVRDAFRNLKEALGQANSKGFQCPDIDIVANNKALVRSTTPDTTAYPSTYTYNQNPKVASPAQTLPAQPQAPAPIIISQPKPSPVQQCPPPTVAIVQPSTAKLSINDLQHANDALKAKLDKIRAYKPVM